MTITASVQQLPTSEGDVLYRELEIMMQRLGHLVGYREKMNWDHAIDMFQLGDNEQLRELKKTAAKNDGSLLFWAKWTKNTIYRNLLLHPNDKGFYLPFRFDEPFSLEIKGKKVWFGSSTRLLEELGWLEMTMEQTDSQEVVEYWENLRELCRSSKEYYSPFQLEHT